ncbi:EpsG-like putative glucosyltransferase [Lutibacter oceani]|uniref:EpsG-like putative glucosyltransferase n=1 Tax=Lutibacter oceani TaxID=1853311 RepID=A0A3D9RT87_9FLAO|nr:EpsG family protein [Lutibacter oceani]REE83087.1 EpsG-like putative glucosyltransferase [Lutibacter oceani]
MIFNSIIPLPFYTPFFYNALLVVILITFLKLQVKGYVIQSASKKEYVSLLFLFAVTLYMGLRPISFVFGDMGIYAKYFREFSNGAEITNNKDYFWRLFMKFCSGIMTVQYFFLLCAILYVIPLYSAAKKWFGTDRYFIFLMLIASFSFWAYGTNGIRNGIATSFVIYGLSLTKNKYLKYGVFLIAYLIHGSVIIPIAAYVLTLFYTNTRHYLIGWLLAIPLSLALGGFWESLFASVGFGGDRLTYLTDARFADQFSRVGFRWDFLLYSAAAVYVGYYFIFKKHFDDKLYHQLFNIYVTANAFWILVIRSSFSNRFAYLSWFLMAIIIFYPFFKQRFFVKQQKVLAYTVLIYYGFTYYMTL